MKVYQDSISPQGGGKSGFISLFIIILLLVATESLASAFSRSLSVLPLIAHLVVFIILAVSIAVFYKKRLTGFRYSILLANENEGSDNSSKQHAPAGSFAVERTVGDSGSLIDVVLPSEMREIVDITPGDAFKDLDIDKFAYAPRIKKGGSGALLIYERDKIRHGIVFSPSDKTKEMLNKIINGIIPDGETDQQYV